MTPLSPIAPTATHASEGTRPRVEGDREQEIFDATLQVLEEVGSDRLTMDAVASAARASKATLYRRWNGKVALVIDALISLRINSTPLSTAPAGLLNVSSGINKRW